MNKPRIFLGSSGKQAKLLQAKHYIPVHYNTWELIAQDGQGWAEGVRQATGAEVHVLKPGESYSL